MQIVINIPEEIYKEACEGLSVLHENVVIQAVSNGTVLPKHGRLIDVDARIKRLKEIKSMVEISNAMADGPQQTMIEKRVKVLAEAIQILQEAPTILEATEDHK